VNDCYKTDIRFSIFMLIILLNALICAFVIHINVLTTFFMGLIIGVIAYYVSNSIANYIIWKVK
jgi:hypothetical protein